MQICCSNFVPNGWFSSRTCEILRFIFILTCTIWKLSRNDNRRLGCSSGVLNSYIPTGKFCNIWNWALYTVFLSSLFSNPEGSYNKHKQKIITRRQVSKLWHWLPHTIAVQPARIHSLTIVSTLTIVWGRLVYNNFITYITFGTLFILFSFRVASFLGLASVIFWHKLLKSDVSF